MTSKHTPGPWRYENHNGTALVYAGSHNLTIYEDACEHSSGWAAESHANARLIAAAPELKDELRRLHTILLGMDPHGLYAAKVGKEVEALLAKADEG